MDLFGPFWYVSHGSRVQDLPWGSYIKWFFEVLCKASRGNAGGFTWLFHQSGHVIRPSLTSHSSTISVDLGHNPHFSEDFCCLQTCRTFVQVCGCLLLCSSWFSEIVSFGLQIEGFPKHLCSHLMFWMESNSGYFYHGSSLLVELWFGHGWTLVWPWLDFSVVLVGLWFNLGCTLVQPWSHFGSVLVSLWFSLGLTLVQPWLPSFIIGPLHASSWVSWHYCFKFIYICSNHNVNMSALLQCSL